MKLNHLALFGFLFKINMVKTLGKECLPPGPTDEFGNSAGIKVVVDQYLDDSEMKQEIIDQYGPMEDWCFTPEVRIFRYLFLGRTDFNVDISNWNVSNVYNFAYMFEEATSFNQDIGGWRFYDKNPTFLWGMFFNAKSFNQNLSGWNVENAYLGNLAEMFRGASSFNGDVSTWNVSSVTRLDMMFRNSGFQGDLSKWEINPKATFDGIFMGTNYSGNAPFCEPNCLAPTRNTKNPDCHLFYHDDGSIDYNTNPARKATVIVPRIVALLSMLASLYVIKGLVFKRKDREKNMKFSLHRMLLGISISDVISSFGYCFMDWASPKYIAPTEVHNGHCSNVYSEWEIAPYAAGNTATCTAQGFFIQTGVIGSILFSGFLSLSCLWTIRYNWREPKLRKVERFLVPFGVVFPLASAIYLAAIQQFNPTPTGFCWIWPYPWLPYPYGGEKWAIKENYRGTENWEIYQLVFGQLWAGLVLITILVSMSMIYSYVRGLSRNNARYEYGGFNNGSQPGDQQSSSIRGRKPRRGLSAKEKLILTKGSLYTGIFVLMYTLAIVTQMVYIGWDYIELISNILLTCQGIFNALVYSNMFTFNITCGCCLPTLKRFRSTRWTFRSTRSFTNRGTNNDADRTARPNEVDLGVIGGDSAEYEPGSVKFSKSLHFEKSVSMHLKKLEEEGQEEDILPFKNIEHICTVEEEDMLGRGEILCEDPSSSDDPNEEGGGNVTSNDNATTAPGDLQGSGIRLQMDAFTTDSGYSFCDSQTVDA